LGANFFPIARTFDLTPFDTQYDSFSNFDAFFYATALAIYLWLNAPFSIMQDFWDIVVEKYREGCNILVLCLGTAVQNSYFKRVIAPLCQVIVKGNVPFSDFEKTNMYGHVLVKFYQADHAEYVGERIRQNGRDFKGDRFSCRDLVLYKPGKPEREYDLKVMIEQFRGQYSISMVARMHMARRIHTSYIFQYFLKHI